MLMLPRRPLHPRPSTRPRVFRARCLDVLKIIASLWVLLATRSAAAYSTNTIVSDPCHEDMTQEALKRARAELGPLDVLKANEQERALIEDVPFRLENGLDDLGAASLVLANHHVDFGGNQPDDLANLAPLHGTPEHQQQHCLRTAAQDGVAGSRAALQDCRDTIRERIEAALDAFDDNGRLDPSARTHLTVALDIRGPVDAELPTYHIQMGQALHTIQDGFSHTYRTEDQLEVVTVLNYIELVDGTLDSAVDGPPHSSALDACRNLDALRSKRLEVATRASTEFLVATLDPELSREEKLNEVDRLLDKYFTHKDGCDYDNNWCDAPEAKYKDPAPGCQVGGALGGASPIAGAPLLCLALFWFRRKHSASPATGGRKRLALAALALASILCTGRAHAQEATDATSPGPEGDPVTNRVLAAEHARIEQPPPIPWGAALNLSGSIENPAVAGALGVRYRLDDNWLVGLDGEYNPWYADSRSEFRRGVASVYATGILRFPMRFERTNLRTTLQLGASRMLFDLYGVPKGTTGPFIGFNLLGIDYELSKQFYLVVNPAHIALPIPQTSGAPFSYMQYRITIGLQLGA